MLLVALGVVVGAALGTCSLGTWFAYGEGPSLHEPVAVDLPPQLTASELAQLLTDIGLVRSPRAMSLFLRATGTLGCVQPGPHLLPPRASPALLRKMLCRSADRPTVKVTIPEGFTRFGIAQRLEQRGVTSSAVFLQMSAQPERLRALGIESVKTTWADTAEGFLFPATYEFHFDSDAGRVLQRLVDESRLRWRQLLDQHEAGFARLADLYGWGRREVLTLASMVEKETAVAAERPVIASVFLNRLADPTFRPKVLQSDPTALYGCLALPEVIPSCSSFSGKPTPAVIHDVKNPYSTYAHPGLPPGPIANPGSASVTAVLAPADTEYLFFVAVGEGGRHVFNKDYEDHQLAVRRLRNKRRR